MPKPRILVLEDDKNEIFLYGARLIELGHADSVDIVFAQCLVEAKKTFRSCRGNFEVIIVDGVMPRYLGEECKFCTPEFVREVRERYNFTGKMIAASSNSEKSRLLVDAGCDSVCLKSDAIATVLGLLGIS